MGLEISRRLVGGVWRTRPSDDVAAAGGGGGGGGGGGSQSVLSGSVTLDAAAWIVACDIDHAVQIVAAPGAGKSIVPLHCIVATPDPNAPSGFPGAVIGTNSIAPTDNGLGTSINDGEVTYFPFPSDSVSPIGGGSVNQPLLVYITDLDNPGSSPIDPGSGPYTMTVLYMVATIPS